MLVVEDEYLLPPVQKGMPEQTASAGINWLGLRYENDCFRSELRDTEEPWFGFIKM